MRQESYAEALESAEKALSEKLDGLGPNEIAYPSQLSGWAKQGMRYYARAALLPQNQMSSCLMSQLLRLDPELVGDVLSVKAQGIGTGIDSGYA